MKAQKSSKSRAGIMVWIMHKVSIVKKPGIIPGEMACTVITLLQRSRRYFWYRWYIWDAG